MNFKVFFITESEYSQKALKLNNLLELLPSEVQSCFEFVEIIYDKKIISYEELLDNFWINIDPFDAYGQFCDKGYSYRSVAFYQNSSEKNLIEKSILKLEKKFNKKVVTYVRKFDKFFMAETRHQNYYKEYLLNYVAYKKACRREEILKRIWSK